MANPILDIVPSYSVDNGVTLTFNANLGTNLVRGSRVEIRDQRQRLIATHIYIPSTYNEASSQHVIPSKQAIINQSTAPNAWSAGTSYVVDDVVAYRGATYLCVKDIQGDTPIDNTEAWLQISNGTTPLSTIGDDFDTTYVNEEQLQYRVATFVDVDTSGTETVPIGLSNNSNARSTWTLPNPIIQFNNISSPIATTSYTINITYDTQQVSGVGKVYNPIESIVWDLYVVEGTNIRMIRSSEVVYNSGIQITPTTYQLNYTFDQLSNGKTYVIACNATSILGMKVEAYSIPILVNATTYQVSAFSVEGDPCNGRIKIVSDIVDVAGQSSKTPENGEINLTNRNDYCIWNQGLGFTNNWTTRIWAYNLNVAEAITTDQAIIHFASSTSGGIIDGYMVEDSSGYRFDLYVYPNGYGGIVNYFQSNVVDNLGTQGNPLCILIGFDYDNSGTYYVRILTS